MWESDSDSDCFEEYLGYRSRMRDSRRLSYHARAATFSPTDEIIERWSTIPNDIKLLALMKMKLCVFWLPTLLNRDDTSPITQWALEVGLINSSYDMTMKQLHKIELVETIFRAMEKGTMRNEKTKQAFCISNRFNLRSTEVMEDAVRWLEQTEENIDLRRIEEFGHINTGYTVLKVLFTEFVRFMYKMGSNLDRTMNTLLAQPPPCDRDKCEEMKKKGNEKFQNQQYEEAVQFYSKAIKYNPENQMVYGNRALCFIRSKKYLKAVCDGKRAVLIDPHWAKAHYRYCEALFLMGELKMAITANKIGRCLCKKDQEGYKDLEQQCMKFVTEMEQSERQSKEQESTKKTQAAETKSAESKTESKYQRFTIDAVMNAPQSKAPEVKTSEKPEAKTNKQPGKNEKMTQAESTAKASKAAKSESSSKSAKAESSAATKKKSKNKNSQSENEKPKAVNLKAAACKELKSMVQDAHTALTDLRSHNAEQAFSQALALVEANNLKELGLSTLDVLLLLYGRALALTEIGQPEELGQAQKLLDKIKSYEERMFQCLVFYAIGKVYLRENRFAVALEQFSDSLQMVKNQITPGKLTWPLTKEIVKETQPDYFKEILENNLELCRFPPPPDAICRLVKCNGASKAEIYFTDPDFKGFIQISCCQSCTVEYHIACWKTMKTSPVFEKSDKDFLQESCFTPDCVGKISCIKIYGPTGLVKCKLEDTIPKPQTPKKPKVNQKCTSLKKLKSKEERKLRRKQMRKSSQENQESSSEILQKKEDSATQSQQKAWQRYRDRVLLQISQHMELLREEKGLQVSILTGSLKPWLELDLSRGNQVARRILNLQEEQPDSTLGQTVELLLERKNRVWARVFVQILSGCPDINPKLNKWACQLNNAGLNAAKSFIERYAGHLEQLDLAFLLNFSPLQEVIIEKLGTRPELFSSIGLTVTEYLKQAPPHDMRLFIWTLEEHREDYDSCHTLLDEYFDLMDGHCSVLKKSDENQNISPMKSRGRKKKHREPRSVFVFPTKRDEFEQDYIEDDSLSFLHPGDPFSVPSHLREQVADFEEQYNNGRHRNHYKNILDNNPDPTKESLYDYFAQILEEHGPLMAEDRLLVGELENFPAVAQQKIKDAGGFECFLLESLRFIKMGRCIGLTRHAVSLQQAGHGARLDELDDLDDLDNLDDLDDIVDTKPKNPPDLTLGHEAAFTPYLDSISSAQTRTYPILPNPYNVFVFGSQPSPPVNSAVTVNDDCLSRWTNSDGQQQSPVFVANDEETDLYCSDAEGGLVETDSSSEGVASVSNEENLLKKHAAVQTCQETMRSVAVNTELHEGFESCPGDLNKKQKRILMLETQIKKMSNSCDKVDLKHKEDIAHLEEEIQKITANVQVTNTELGLFQQKLEEEVKKDQNEKKANQEVLKSLKTEIEDLVEEHKSLTRNIREKKSTYDAKLRDFLELSNQSAAEKMSLEDEIRRSKATFPLTKRRSNNAQLSIVESQRDQDLHNLYRELTHNKALLIKLDEAMHRHPSEHLDLIRKDWRASMQEIEEEISTIETKYKEQMDQVKKGRRVNELLPVSGENQQEPATASSSASATNVAPQSSAGASGSSPPLTQQAAAEAPAAPPHTQHRPPNRTSGPLHSNTVFDKAIDRLSTMFPTYTRPELSRLVKELRLSSGGSLSSMSLQDMVGGVSQLILDHQEKLNSAAKSSRTGRGTPSQSVTPPLVNSVPVWQQPVPQRATQSSALNVEDPCIICHDDMSPDNICVLECRHSFHHDCIRSWLKEQSTCPTCRDHALLPEEFPALSGRRRQAP
ncbi:E3 ubiquitin-protein ligase TTC3 isoform X2 [Cheilinus undulatus]|uniref:E3 ubiquitin-protein ligase TTC3 isoform X2 n=1 Tax=Cheilinus undulatus TaxID=241271 RepID=UPI001BD60749|nr:E3 ubiquitin-protein ligase TTC3 isoform X2 [Cheilinus undulatus]